MQMTKQPIKSIIFATLLISTLNACNNGSNTSSSTTIANSVSNLTSSTGSNGILLPDTQCQQLINNGFSGLNSDFVYCTPSNPQAWYQTVTVIYNATSEQQVGINFSGSSDSCDTINWNELITSDSNISNVIAADTTCSNNSFNFHRLGLASFGSKYQVGQLIFNFTDGNTYNNILNPTISLTQSTEIAPTNQIFYHIADFPLTSNPQEYLTLNSNSTDLIMSNYIAGVMLGHLMIKHGLDASAFNKDYVYGTLFAQLLQENGDTSKYNGQSQWINSMPGTTNIDRSTLVPQAPGGPFQLNNYAVRLNSGYGLVNFVAIQKGLNFTVASQDDGSQQKIIGPDSLVDKNFAPMAAAYFHYNDLLIAEKNLKNFGQCEANLVNTNNNSFLDMILNSIYNSGENGAMAAAYVNLCVDLTNPSTSEQNALAHIDDYSLDSSQYMQLLGISEGQPEYYRYPRQARFHDDELYNNLGSQTNNSMVFTMTQLQNVFTNVFHNLAYSTDGIHSSYINQNDAGAAFVQALNANGVSTTAQYDMSKSNERQKIYSILEAAITNLEQNLGTDFTATTNTTLQ
jgi:hypothetical protein